VSKVNDDNGYMTPQQERESHAELVADGIAARKESDARAKAAHNASIEFVDASQRPKRSGTNCEDISAVTARILAQTRAANEKSARDHGLAAHGPAQVQAGEGKPGLDVNACRERMERFERRPMRDADDVKEIL